MWNISDLRNPEFSFFNICFISYWQKCKSLRCYCDVQCLQVLLFLTLKYLDTEHMNHKVLIRSSETGGWTLSSRCRKMSNINEIWNTHSAEFLTEHIQLVCFRSSAESSAAQVSSTHWNLKNMKRLFLWTLILTSEVMKSCGSVTLNDSLCVSCLSLPAVSLPPVQISSLELEELLHKQQTRYKKNMFSH